MLGKINLFHITSLIIVGYTSYYYLDKYKSSKKKVDSTKSTNSNPDSIIKCYFKNLLAKTNFVNYQYVAKIFNEETESPFDSKQKIYKYTVKKGSFESFESLYQHDLRGYSSLKNQIDYMIKDYMKKNSISIIEQKRLLIDANEWVANFAIGEFTDKNCLLLKVGERTEELTELTETNLRDETSTPANMIRPISSLVPSSPFTMEMNGSVRQVSPVSPVSPVGLVSPLGSVSPVSPVVKVCPIVKKNQDIFGVSKEISDNVLGLTSPTG